MQRERRGTGAGLTSERFTQKSEPALHHRNWRQMKFQPVRIQRTAHTQEKKAARKEKPAVTHFINHVNI